MNTSWSGDLILLQHLTQVVLHTLETGGPNMLSPSDILYLSQRIESELSAVTASEVLVSIITNYVKVASLMLEPHMAAQWMGQTTDGVGR